MLHAAQRDHWDHTVTQILPVVNGLASFGKQKGVDFYDLHPLRSADEVQVDEQELRAMAFVKQIQSLRALPEKEHREALEKLKRRDGISETNPSGVGIY